MQINVTAKNIELTDAISSYVEKKFDALDKFFGGIIRAGVTLGLESTHHNKGDIFFTECKLEVPGNDLFVKKEEASLYKAIDKVQDHLREELKKYLEKNSTELREEHNAIRENKGYKLDEEQD